MKLKCKYEELKEIYKYEIILLKSGVFYLSFNDDALLMNNIFNYQIKNNRLGFPIKVLDSIALKLRELNINFIIYDSEIVEHFVTEHNAYLRYYDDCKRLEFHELSKKVLFDRINYLLEANPLNYDKIRKFIDEL